MQKPGAALAQFAAVLILVSAGGLRLGAAEYVADKGNYPPPVAPASNEGELALKGFTVPEGLKVELVAAEPHLANPVAFTIDENGRFYVVETFRLHAGVTDIRGHMDWLDEELAVKTVEEAAAAIDAINADFECHSKSAHELANELFATEKVLGKFLQELGF